MHSFYYCVTYRPYVMTEGCVEGMAVFIANSLLDKEKIKLGCPHVAKGLASGGLTTSMPLAATMMIFKRLCCIILRKNAQFYCIYEDVASGFGN